MSEVSRPEPSSRAPKRRAKRRAKPTRKHTIARVIGISLLSLGMVAGLGVVYLYAHLQGNVEVQDINDLVGDRPEKVYNGNGSPMNILVLGDDTREGENKIDNESGGGSDTTILVHLSADRSRAYAVSIPRDSIVERPACGAEDQIPGASSAMWNAAYSYGAAHPDYATGERKSSGAACTIEQLEANTGIFVDQYVVVDFNGFQKMVDAVGGVDVCVPAPIDDSKANIHIPAGKDVTLNGKTALDYFRVRTGTGLDGSDIGRIKRQQNFIAALVSEVKSAGTLTRLDRVINFLDAATESLTTDFTSLPRMGKVAMQLQGIGLDKVQFITVPNAYYTRDSGFWGRVYWTEEADVLWKALREDTLLPPELTQGAINAGNVPGKRNGKKGDTGEASESPSPTVAPTTTPEEQEAAREEAEKVGLCA